MPMLFCLLDEIGEQPPYDLMANAQAKAMERKEETDAKGSLQSFGAVKGKVRRRPNGD